MRVIIDIPEETKQAFDKAESNDLKDGYYDHGGIIGKAIKNGIPLDDVKAEITALRYGSDTYKYAIDDVLEILDNIGKAESKIHCDYTDEEIAKSFIEDVEAVKDLLNQSLEDVIDAS